MAVEEKNSVAEERLDPSKKLRPLIRYEHIGRYRYAVKRVGERVLDLGCGLGYGTRMIFDKSKKDVIGMDISADAIEYAKKNYPGPKYVVGSAEKLPFSDAYFDSVIAFEIIEHVDDPDRVLAEISRVLKPKGRLFISTPNPKHFRHMLLHYLAGAPWPAQAYPNKYHKKEFAYDEFIALLKGHGFAIKHSFGQTIPVWVEGLIARIKPLYWIYSSISYVLPRLSFIVVADAIKNET